MKVYVPPIAAALIFASAISAHQFRFSTPLSGADESTSNISPAIGSALVTIDEDENTMRVQVSFNDLLGTVTGANVFALTGEPMTGTAMPVMLDTTTDPPATTLPDFPLGDSSGVYDRTINLAIESTYNPGFVSTYGGAGFDRISKALSTLIAGLNDREAYFNITTSAYPNGEIRGFLVYLLGDYNNNGVVDAADYTVWRDSLGQTGEGLDADSDNSNSIDEIDYTAWQQSFGHSRFDLSFGAGSAAVPEPTSIVLLSITAVAALFWRLGR